MREKWAKMRQHKGDKGEQQGEGTKKMDKTKSDEIKVILFTFNFLYHLSIILFQTIDVYEKRNQN